MSTCLTQPLGAGKGFKLNNFCFGDIALCASHLAVYVS